MKYAAVLAFAAGALASPQAASITSAPVAIPTSLLANQSSAIACVNSCKPEDVNCKAQCLGIARPNASQAIDTTKCAAKCDQGDGSPAATDKYSQCVQSCIASLFPSSQTAFGAGGNPANGGASTASGAAASASARASGSGAQASGSPTGSAAGTQQSNAAGSNSARLAGAGFAGLLAVFAL